MKVRAFAKINLGLRILGKRADGFHEIETIFVRIGLFDELEIRLRKDSQILVHTKNAEISKEQNLAWRAAWLLQKFSPKKVGVEIQLKKRIPIGAGLGGGSSDAAAILKTLPRLWKLKIAPQKLSQIAASLGSDVPFFLEKTACRARGRGEILEPIALPKKFPREIIVVVPPVVIATEWAYGRIKDKGLRSKKIKFENDFERVVFREYPEIRQIKKTLEKAGAEIASLSGSGSAVFGLFRKKPSRELISQLEKFGQVFFGKIRS
ncbi:MAG: 4-(cytidine 5'-diphospho)-2-C-methyl-D-erythritol kinase [Patescibacteria group bacterium]